MTARDEAERAIADVLAGHRYWCQDIGQIHFICYCNTPQTAFLDREGHEAHVASLLADLMADGLAKAWSEGYAEGIIHMGMSIEDHGKQPGNPYRRTPEGETDE